MTADLLRVLLFAALASSMAMLLVLALRKPMRVRFGAAAACALWALVPLSAAAALLPAPPTPVSMSVLIVPLAATDLVTAAPPLLSSGADHADAARGVHRTGTSSAEILGGEGVDGSIAYRQLLESDNPYDPKFERRVGTATVEPLIPVNPPPKGDAAAKTPDPAKQE